MSDVKGLVESTIDGNDIAVFSKSWCPYCRQAKQTLQSKAADLPIKILELDEIDNGDEIQAYLKHKTGQSTVPNIFIKKQHVGGNDSLQAAIRDRSFETLVKA